MPHSYTLYASYVLIRAPICPRPLPIDCSLLEGREREGHEDGSVVLDRLPQDLRQYLYFCTALLVRSTILTHLHIVPPVRGYVQRLASLQVLQLRLSSSAIKLLRRYSGAIKTLFRRYSGAIQALFRQYIQGLGIIQALQVY